MKKSDGLILLSILAFLLVLFFLNQTVFNIEAETIQSEIIELGVIAPFVYVFFYSVRPLILFPASVLSLAGGLAFGPLYGTLLTLTGASIGAYLSFLVSRKVGSKWIEKKGGHRVLKLKDSLEQKGFIVVLVMRLVPLFPFDLVSYTAGLSKIKTRDFMLATVLGMIPGTFVYTFLGANALSSNMGRVALAGGLFIVITLIPTLFQKKIRKLLKMKDESEE
ncbi:TVP38/TMEM64 family protein [Carnobacterium funditum]|uniref:TVP38/TMEM64 family protein n=1 Tax=Carnobacterium funditum TaxID=2752 RepID=UPI000557865C|nr:TVP38/TMEM64 family protein [Carnobacterium funditum]